MPIVTSGVTLSEIGNKYDVAIGYSDDGATAEMVGFILSPNTTWSEKTDITDEEHLVQIGTPSNSDRFGRYPTISQGDWSGGERQLYFNNANQYFTTGGMLNVTNPGQLTLLPSGRTIAIPSSFTPNGNAPLASDGTTVLLGGSSSTAAAVLDQSGAQMDITGATGSVTDLRCFNGQFYAVCGNGIWQFSAGSGVLNSITQMTSDTPAATTPQPMSYWGGAIYYAIGNVLKFVNAPVGNVAGSTADTITSLEGGLTVLCGGASNLLLVSGSYPNIVNAGLESHLMTWDGSTLNRLGSIRGTAVAALYMNGSIYLLTADPGITQYLLYRVDGTSVTLLDDTRNLLAAFQNQVGTAVAQSAFPAGTVMWQASSTVPPGWLLADGTAYAASAYPALFATVGHAYGGSGSTFNVPDLRGRLGMGTSGSHALGSAGGAETVTLDTTTLPAHDHGATGIESVNHTHTSTIARGTSGGPGLRDSGTADSSGFVPPTAGVSNDHVHPTAAAGGGGAHNNLQPFMALTPIIKASNSLFSTSFLGASLVGDGRFVFLGWPGLAGLRYDTLIGAWSRIGSGYQPPSSGTNWVAHRFELTPSTVYELLHSETASGEAFTWYVYDQAPTSDTLTTSFFDATVPEYGKRWMSVEFQLAQALPAGASVALAYLLDQDTAFSVPITAVATQGTYTAYLPPDTIGHRIQFQVILTAGSGGSPTVAFYSVRYTLGRVMDFTVACYSQQTLLDGSQDAKTGIEKLAVLHNIRKLAGGDAVLFIPRPTEGPTYVSQINAKLVDYNDTRQRPSPGDGTDRPFDIEGDVQLTFAESL